MRILKPKAFQGENMLQQLLLTCISIYIASETWKLLRHTSRGFTEKRAKRYRKIGGEDRISALPDDLLVHILMFVQTKDVVATMTLSKRWRFVWTMVPQLVFREIEYGTHKRFIGGLLDRLFGKSDQLSIWQFLHKSLQLHRAPVLQTLVIELGPRCPIDIDVGNCIASAVERRVRVLCFELTWSAEPTGLPKSLYTCDTLYCLSLSDKIFLDVPSSACLPSLQHLTLYSVVYKDEDSHARFLSSCPILKYLVVKRQHKDNVTRFIVKVTSLESLVYDNEEVGGVLQNGSLVIDCPALKNIFIRDFSGGSCSIENEPQFVEATIHLFGYPDEKFIRSLSSVIYLELVLDIPTVVCCDAINFSQLIESKIALQIEFDWIESLMLFLHNSPNLKVLFIQQLYKFGEDFPLSWKQQSSVPGCLSTNLEIFEWKDYGGRSEEKQLVRYIFDNSKSLKRIGISMKSTCNRRDQRKMKKELEYMPRVSTSSQLLFFTQLDIWKVWKFKF